MTELARYQGSGEVAAYRPAAAPAPASQAGQLVEWAQAAQSAYQLAEGLVGTSFCPEGFRNKPYDAAAAILAGSEVGLSPMGALRSFDVIQGSAAPRAMALRAIVQSRGHDIWVVESTSVRAIVSGKRAGSSQTQTSEWTIDRARNMGLTSKQNWKNQPGAMLVARATGEVCRLIASDAILGMPYASEELFDDAPAPSAAVPAGERPRRTAQRRKPAAAVPVQEPVGPPLPGEDEPADESDDDPADGPQPASRAQLTKLHAQLGDLKVTEREDKLTTVTLLVKRSLTSSAELTKDEASRLIETLDGVLASAEPLREFDALLASLEDDTEGGQR